MPSIGADQANTPPPIDIRAQFGSVAFDAKGREIQIQQPQVQQKAQMPDPNDPWAHTGQGQTPIMNGMAAAEHNFDTTNSSIKTGAGYMMDQAGAQLSELTSGIMSLFKSPEPDLPDNSPQLAMDRKFIPAAPQPGGGLFN